MYIQSAGTRRDQRQLIAVRLASEGKTMDDKIREWARQQIIEQNKDTAYCDLILSGDEAKALEQLVNELRAAGRHPTLERVFSTILEEIEGSRNWNPGDPWPELGKPD